MTNERMTPADFKAEYRRKGWTGRMLADRWQKSVAWISKIGNDPERELHWDDAVKGLPDEKLNYSSIFTLPEVEAWFNIENEDEPRENEDMPGLLSLMKYFTQAYRVEGQLVQRASIELLHYFQLADRYGWLAVKDQIDRAAAKAHITPGHIALQWIKAAQDKKLEHHLEQDGALVITEAR